MFKKIKIVFLAILALILMNGKQVQAVEQYNTAPTDKYMSIDMAEKVIERIKVLDNSFNVTAEDFATYFNDNFFNSPNNTLDIDFRNINLAFDPTNKIMYIIPANNTFSDNLNYMYFKTSYKEDAVQDKDYIARIYATSSLSDTTDRQLVPYVKIFLSRMEFKWETNTAYTNIQLYASSENYHQNNILNEDKTILTSPYIYTFVPTSSFYYSFNNSEGYLQENISKTPVFSYYSYDNYQSVEEPETPSGDTGDNVSGDTGGNTNIGDKIDNIQGSLDNIKDKIPTSGDIKNTINEVINNMFEIESGEVQEILDNYDLKLDVENNKDLEENILKTLQGEPEDFVISWEDVKYMDTVLVPKGEVNFSKVARDNEAIGEAKTWLNIICSMALILLLGANYWSTICSFLGIRKDIYETYTEEGDLLIATSEEDLRQGYENPHGYAEIKSNANHGVQDRKHYPSNWHG